MNTLQHNRAMDECKMIFKLIGVIYFYIISGAAIVLILIGVFNLGNFIINSTQFEEYPTRYGLDNCNNPYLFNPKGPYPANLPPEASVSASEIKVQKEQCLKNADFDRKQHKLDDIKNTVLYLFSGIILFLIHFPQARKQSNLKNY